MAKLVKAIKDKVAYERESYRLSQEYMTALRKERPELWEKKGGKR